MANKENYASSWIEFAKAEYGSVQKGVDKMNLVCNTKLQTSSVYSMANEKRNIPDCVEYHMLHDILPAELKSAGFKAGDIKKLLSRIAPPRRCK